MIIVIEKKKKKLTASVFIIIENLRQGEHNLGKIICCQFLYIYFFFLLMLAEVYINMHFTNYCFLFNCRFPNHCQNMENNSNEYRPPIPPHRNIDTRLCGSSYICNVSINE